MRVALDVSYHGLTRSDFLDELIRGEVEKLEQVCDYLVSCRIGIKYDQKSRQTGNPFRIRIEMRVPPGHNLVVTHETGLKEAAAEVNVALKRAFKTARRRLRELVAKQQGEVKSHPQQETVALVSRLFPGEDYGFLRTVDGEEVYFHRNSVLRNDFDRLEIGTGVNFAAEMGEEGLQASSVQIVDKPGARSR